MKRSKGFYFLFLIFFLFQSCQTKKGLKDPLEAGWKGKKVCKVLEENDKVRSLKCVFPPGIGHEKHFHKAHFAYTFV